MVRQAFGGMLWSKQPFYYEVTRRLDGDPTRLTPPYQLLTGATPGGATSTPSTSCRCRTSESTCGRVGLSVDCVALAHVDAGFAK